jgi:DNA polymerase elongation subunit (family B)
MIIDTFRPDPTGPDHIYKRWRDAEGNLIEETVTDFEPYFWIKASTPKRVIERVLNRYPGSYVDETDTAEALRTGDPLIKVYAYRNSDIRDMTREFGFTWEADLSLVDRYLIDNISEMPEWKPRVWHFDLEWDPKTDETTVMAVVDSYNNRKVAFCWMKDNPTGLYEMDNYIEEKEVEYTVNGVPVSFTYERHLYGSEEDMHIAFMNYMDECNPDVLVAHAIMWADLPHLVRRLPDHRKLSPLGRVIRPRQDGSYDYVAQPIIGRLCFDTAAPLRSGSGFERVWKDSGKPQLKNLKLDTIASTLGYGGKFDMDVFTGWTERFDDYVDYCMQDTILLKKIDEENHVLNFFMSLQRICGVSFPSCHNVTRFARGLLSRRTHWKAPSRSRQEKQEYEGAFIPPPKPGRYEGVACVDYKGLYPSIILSHNLSWETQVPSHRKNEANVRELPDGTCWMQGTDALLPKIVNEMFDLRDMYKQKMREASSENERNGWNTLQLAVKRVMASFYGMTASAYWGWSDFDIASAITACGRRAIKFLMEESENQGYSSLYGHTDSAFVEVPFDEAHALAKHLTETVQREHESSHLIVEFEAYMPYWIVGGKNLYYGICSWPPEDEGKKKSARWGKISTLAPISKNLENDVLTAICSGASEDEVIGMIRPISKRIKRGDVKLSEVASTTRLQKSLSAYSATTGGAVKGTRYFNEHLATTDKYGEGDSVNWVYVIKAPDNLPPTDVVVYQKETDLDGFDLDYDKMVDKLVKQKMKGIFGALDWNLEFASGAAQPKKYW